MLELVWLHREGVASLRVSLSGCAESSWPHGLLWSCGAGAPLTESTGSRARASVAVGPQALSAGSVVVAHGLGCSVARGIFPDQGLNLCLLHWQADSLPVSHQGNLHKFFILHAIQTSPIPVQAPGIETQC